MAGELTAEFGHLLPGSLIHSTIQAACTFATDDAQAERDARTDVAQLAEAALRRPDPTAS